MDGGSPSPRKGPLLVEPETSQSPRTGPRCVTRPGGHREASVPKARVQKRRPGRYWPHGAGGSAHRLRAGPLGHARDVRGKPEWHPRHVARPLGKESLARSPDGERQGGPGFGLARPCPSHPRAWGTHPGGHPGNEAPQDIPLLLLLLRPGMTREVLSGLRAWPLLTASGPVAKPLLRVLVSKNQDLCVFDFHKLFCKRGRRGGCAFPVPSLPWKRVPPRVFQAPLVCFKAPLVCFEPPLCVSRPP